jgi:pimeloyl-ACP methyl ester carboxylesterase
LRAHFIDGCDYRSLTLIDPVAARPWGSPLVQHVREYEAAFAGMPAYMHEAILPAYLRSALYRPITDEALAPYIEPWKGEAGQRAFYAQIAQMDMAQTDEVQGRYGELRCPVQVLWGEEDRWIPIERGRELAALLPNARLMAVPESGHLMQEDAPEAIVAAVLAFLHELKDAP